MNKVKTILLILGILVISVPLMILTAFNTQTVEVNYLIGTISQPLPVLILGAFTAGVLIVLIFFGISGFIWKSRAKSLQKQIERIHKNEQIKRIEADYTASKS